MQWTSFWYVYGWNVIILFGAIPVPDDQTDQWRQLEFGRWNRHSPKPRSPLKHIQRIVPYVLDNSVGKNLVYILIAHDQSRFYFFEKKNKRLTDGTECS